SSLRLCPPVSLLLPYTTLFRSLSREPLNPEPLQLYLLMSEMDRGRPADQWLTAQTVRLLAEKFRRFGDQYPVFAEFSALDNDSRSEEHTSELQSLTNLVCRLLR